MQTADLAVIVHAYGDFDLFKILGKEIYVLCQGRLPEDPPGLGYWVLQHAMRLADMGRFEQAEHQLRAVYEILHTALGSGHVRTEEARDRLATLYESWDRSEPGKGYDARAAEWRAKLPLSVDEEGEPSPQP